MAATTPEKATAAREESPAAKGDAAEEKAAPAAGGGIKPWLPLIISVVVMPALAFATTEFVLIPKMQKSASAGGAATETASPAASSSSEGGKGGEKGGSSKNKVTVAMSKMLVNVSGTMGTRYLMTSVTLVGSSPDFKGKIEDNKDQLMDLATGTLSTKTISDLEKPGARNVIRAELMTVFNNALGGPVVQEIYITELAIQ